MTFFIGMILTYLVLEYALCVYAGYILPHSRDFSPFVLLLALGVVGTFVLLLTRLVGWV